MGGGAFSRMGAHVARRRALSVLAASAALVVAWASPAAAAQKPDTFSGSCTGAEGQAWWPDHPLTVVPIDMRMFARMSGGECSGTLNGRKVQSVPAVISASLHGIQSCEVGEQSGRFWFKLAGHTISGAMTYRRVGPRITVLWQGDDGGASVAEVHARIGVVRQDDPLAATPVVGPLISGPITNQDVVSACAGDGLPRAPIAVDALATTPSLSG
jgi:hypothetical protein